MKGVVRCHSSEQVPELNLHYIYGFSSVCTVSVFSVLTLSFRPRSPLALVSDPKWVVELVRDQLSEWKFNFFSCFSSDLWEYSSHHQSADPSSLQTGQVEERNQHLLFWYFLEGSFNLQYPILQMIRNLALKWLLMLLKR